MSWRREGAGIQLLSRDTGKQRCSSAERGWKTSQGVPTVTVVPLERRELKPGEGMVAKGGQEGLASPPSGPPEVTTHIELVKEIISGVLVLHEQPQVLEHLERRKGQPWSGPRN